MCNTEERTPEALDSQSDLLPDVSHFVIIFLSFLLCVNSHHNNVILHISLFVFLSIFVKPWYFKVMNITPIKQRNCVDPNLLQKSTDVNIMWKNEYKSKSEQLLSKYQKLFLDHKSFRICEICNQESSNDGSAESRTIRLHSSLASAYSSDVVISHNGKLTSEGSPY